MEKKQDNKNIQLVWGIALVAMGLGVFFRIPQVMPKIEAVEQFSSAAGYIRFCFYFMGVFLVGGGVRKIIHLYQQRHPE
ncbi:MAG: hypothetical protein HKM93_07980 [Desulfobacteraceae bacterium]|nr:hypothetical protein [Desulfobacteraceae bacterium]